MLDIWPALPLAIVSDDDNPTGSVDNIIAALECVDRVNLIHLKIVQNLGLVISLAVMQQPFPELIILYLLSDGETVASIPDSFLGGSAPRLERLLLERIPFPGLPKLLLSAAHLHSLYLRHIPHSGYISPDRMVAALSTLTILEHLVLEFDSPRSCPNRESRLPPPSTRSVLPVLTTFQFKGVNEYLDDLVACIDVPQLRYMEITFFNDIDFDTPQFMQFISRTPMSRVFGKAHITLHDRAARISFSSQTSRYGKFEVEILCRGLDWQVSSLEQVCTSCSPFLSILEVLYFDENSNSPPDWKDSVENRQWLELFRLFTAVKSLYLSEKFASRIAPALQELVESRTTGVLPALQNIFLKGLESSGSVQETIGQFVAARQVANHPIVISPWTDSEEGED